MEFSRTHLITHVLLVMISSAASLTFNLKNIGPQNQNRDIFTEGNGAYISDGGIQVTPDGIGSDRSQKAGRATYVQPLHLWDRESGELASFITNFTFVIDSDGARAYADGLTFFLAQNNSLITAGGAMGLPVDAVTIAAINQFVAVEFDTYWNTGWDPSLKSSNNPMGDHVGISISSLRSVRTHKWLSNVAGGGVCQAWITYDSPSRNLSVSFTGFQNNTVFRQDGLHYVIDLKEVLPEWVIFGFSAATGALFEKNNVRSWSFNSSELEVDKNNEPPLLPPIGLIVGLPVVITFLGVLVLVLWRRKKKTREVEEEETGFDIEMDNEFEMGTGRKRFTYHELAQATSDFAENERLGEGGFGGVYRGFLKDSNTFVVVKRVSKSSKQGIKEYAPEVRIISRSRHRNLVQLIGALIECIVSLATSCMVQLSSNKTGSAAMKTKMESRFKHLREDTRLNVKNMMFNDRLVINIVALGYKKRNVQLEVMGHVLTVAASAITPDGPKALIGPVDIQKDVFYDAKRVSWDLADGYLRVTFPFGTAYTMVQGSFYVPWAPYEEPTIEQSSAADGAGSSSKDGTEQMMEQEAGNEKAEDDEHEKKVELKDGDGHENVDGSGKI